MTLLSRPRRGTTLPGMPGWLLAPILLAGASGCLFHFDRSLSPGEVRGTVVIAPSPGASLVPVSGARIVFEDSSINVTTDSAGTFDVTQVPAGTYAIDITTPPGDAGTFRAGLRLTGITLAPLSGGGLGDGVDLGRIVLETLGGIAGTVTSEGTTVTGAFAVLPDFAQTVTVDGGYSFANLMSGSYTLSVVDPTNPGTRTAPSVSVTVQPGAITHVPDIAIPVTATVVTQGGIQGTVQLVGASSSKGATIALLGTSITVQTQDAAGDYAQSAIPADVYTLTASAPGFKTATVAGIIVGGATTQVPLITLQPGSNPPAQPSTIGGSFSVRSTNFHMVLNPGRAQQPAQSPGFRLEPGAIVVGSASDGGAL